MKPYVPILVILLLVSSSYVGVSNTAIESEMDMEQPLQTSGPPMDSPWPMKCHDTHHTSRSPFITDYNLGEEKWRFRSEKDGGMESSAVIDNDGIIYFGTMGSDHKLYALYPNGTKKWSYEVGLAIWSTPAIAEDGTIYVTSYDNHLYAVYPNGTMNWNFDTGDSISSSPAIAEDGTIYFGCTNKKIFAINPNGTEKWHYNTDYIIVSDPAIGDDGTIYIGSGDSYFYAMHPNGTLHWRFKTGDWIKSHPSIADDGTIYFDSFDDYLYALYPNGSLKWKIKGMGTGCGSAAISEDGTIYFGGSNLYAIYPNGTIKWSLSLGGGNTGHTSPAISADGTIYVCTEEGRNFVAVNSNGTEKWRQEICNLRADSSPIIGEDGTVYVGSSWEDEHGNWFGYLHAFGRGELDVDANGPYYGLIDEPMQFTGSAQGGYHPYAWVWDFGDTYSSDEQNPTHIYSAPGNYTVRLTVTDNTSNQSIDTTWAWIQETNDPPDKPSIDGETNGKKGKSYDYTFVTTDPDENDVWYHIGWGDKEIIYIYGPYQSGESITLSYTWTEKGDYTITCWATDVYDEASEFATLDVTMPKFHNPIWWLSGLLERFPLLSRLLGWLM